MASIPPTGDPFLDASKAVRLSRDCNEFAARLAADHPGRFGVFAATPLPNIDATLNEIEYAFDSLKADGIALFTSYGDKWLGDLAFNPVFEELNRLGTTVLIATHDRGLIEKARAREMRLVDGRLVELRAQRL